MKADQCLFGYRDGHRLLATSMSLEDDVTILTQFSDLAPDTMFGASDGYWTGLPVPGIRRYALMRTWLAPEMPRPGCVWTHAILLDPAVLEAVADLSTLRYQVCRPRSLDDLAAYSCMLTLGDLSAAVPSEPAILPPDALHQLLSALYGTSKPVVATGAPGTLDDAIFAIWSQQWPRLRRNLRFQTAASRTVPAPSGAHLDLMQVLSNPLPVTYADYGKGQEWLDAAVEDIKRGGGPLRNALWRYGRDVRRQRGSFRPLCEVEIIRKSSHDDIGLRLLRIIADAFPEPDNATTLKQDAVDGVLAPSAQLDILNFVLVEPDKEMMPLPSVAGVARLANLWSDGADKLLQLAEHTVDLDGKIHRSIFDTITETMPIQRFWEITRSFPRVREKMVAIRPELMTAEGAIAIDNQTLASLLRLLPKDDEIAQKVISSLLTRDDPGLARITNELFPEAVAPQVITAANRKTIEVASAWLTEIVQRPQALLDPAILGRVSRTSLLYDIAEALGWLTPDVIVAGTEPWLAALVDIRSDLTDDRRDTLLTFLVGVAIAAGGKGGQRVFELFFDVVHGQILKSRLPRKAYDILTPVLPEVGWIYGRDLGLRLRLAVASRYMVSGYDPDSYARLSLSQKTTAMLADAAEDVNRGRKPVRSR